MGEERDEIKIRVCPQKKQKLQALARKKQIAMNQLILELIDRGLEKDRLLSQEVQKSLIRDLQKLISIFIKLELEVSQETASYFVSLATNLVTQINSLLFVR